MGGLGNLVDVVGTKLGLPELGLSERIAGGSTTNTGRTPQSRAAGYSAPAAPMSVAPAQSKVLGAATSSGGGAPAGGSTLARPIATPSPQELGLPTEDIERGRTDQVQAKSQDAIEAGYSPIFSELDRQIGLLGPEKEKFMSTIGNLAESQKGVVAIEEGKGMRGLDAAQTQEEGLAKGSIRELEQDVRNQIKSFGNYIGSVGAGDSSAGIVGSELIGRAALRSRGAIKQGLGNAVNAINLKRQDVRDLASTQLSKIEQFTSEKILETENFFADRLNNLQTSLASARGAKAQAIGEMIANTEQQFVNRLRELDNQVFGYKSAISQWQTQREADLEDYSTKLGIASSYNGAGDSSAIQRKAIADFNSLVSAGTTQGQALQTVKSIYGESALAGLELSGDDEGRRKESPLADLERSLVSNINLDQPQQQSGGGLTGLLQNIF